jgi:hypothetical protein
MFAAWDQRNGIKERAPGDKSYHVPEYEARFHHHGSTLPSPSFGYVFHIIFSMHSGFLTFF